VRSIGKKHSSRRTGQLKTFGPPARWTGSTSPSHRRGARLPRPERRRQVHHHPGPARAAAADAGQAACSAATRGTTRSPCTAAWPTCPATSSCGRTSPAARRSTCSAGCAAGSTGPPRRAVERFDLDPTKKGRTYSKGNRQKVALIVAALASDVELLLLDEPTAGLDPLMEAVFQDVIREVKAVGAHVLLSSHILAQVEKLADRISIIRQGRIVESGTLAELRHLTRTTIEAETARPATGLAGCPASTTSRPRRRPGAVRGRRRPPRRPGHLPVRVRSLTSHPPTLEELMLRHYGDDRHPHAVAVRPAPGPDPLPAWLAGIGLLQVAGAASYPGLYPTVVERQAQAAIIEASPAMKVMTGPGHGLADYTYGAMVSNEFLGFVAVMVALMSVLTVVRHTRTEEESGRAELVRSHVVGRHAYLAAALATAGVASAGLGAVIAVGMGALGIESVDWPGSLAFGAAYAAVGLVFAGVAAVTAQVTEYGRAAAGLAGALIAVAYLLRAVGDLTGGGLSWLSPIGWAQAAAPYVDDRWWPLGLALLAAAGLAGVAFAVNARRDVGAGLASRRGGAAYAAPWLGTATGSAWRLQRAAVAWWALAVAVGGAAYGSASGIVEDYADNEIVRDLLGDIPGGTLVESWLSMIIALLAIVCTIFGITAASRPGREEAAGRAEAVLATALSRVRWMGGHLLVALGGAVLLLAVMGAALGATAGASLGDPGLVGRTTLAALAYTPAVWLVTGLASAAYGLAPRLAGLGWALLGYAFVAVYLGGLLQLPGWLLDLSPYTHVPRLPAAELTVIPLVVLTAVAAGLVATGLYGIRRRDLRMS
jgi:ABC-2 type transport system permease protein